MVFRTYTDEVRREGDNTKSFEAAEPILQGQLVKLDTDSPGRTVEPSDTDGEAIIGFAEYDAAAGQDVSVCLTGTVVRATSATGTITSGTYVASGGGVTGEEGEVKAHAAGEHTVGVALEDDAGANGDVWVYVDLGAGGEVNA